MDNGYNDLPRRRRRTETDPEENINETAAEEEGIPEVKAEGTDPAGEPEGSAAAPENDADTAAREAAADAQGPYSRIPSQARQMAAAPYGTRSEGAKRPGTRPMAAERRPGTRPASGVRRPETQARRPETQVRRQAAPGAQGGPEQGDMTQPHVRVGYAPGRMNDGQTQMVPAAEEAPRRERKNLDITGLEHLGIDSSGRTVRKNNSQNAREYLERRKQPFRSVPGEQQNTPKKPVNKKLRRAVIILLVIGLALAGFMMLPEDNALRVFGRNALSGLFGGKPGNESLKVISFTQSDPSEKTAPADVSFSIETGKDVADIRLTDDDGGVMAVEVTAAENTDEKAWIATLHVEYGFEGMLYLEVRKEGGSWQRTEYAENVTVLQRPAATDMPPAADTQAPEPGAEEGGAETAEAPEESADTPEAVPEAGTPEETAPAEGGSADLWQDDNGDNTDDWPDDYDEPAAEGTDEAAEAAAIAAALPTAEPEATPEPTPVPELTVEAADDADPGIITNVTVYVGTKKVKEYSRASKEIVRMPIAGQYSKQKTGILTFRGDAFRQNAAAGTLNGRPTGLEVLWSVEGGSSRGASQTYYGYTWTGQPAIVKWAKQVRAASDLFKSKLEKTSLKEVIIAGMDGVVRFIDLEDGTLTRNGIKLGYPFKGTPSIHPGGMPFMTVGQYARKMKTSTGKIGLRQYNLYNMKELKMIDGLDTKKHRPLNNAGSFNTSALIDRTSDTVIAVGSNGALYLESVNPTFDYLAGVLTTSMETTMMTSKVKGRKTAAYYAVESSPAMYDRYVYYADMGGVLRCVDTDTLTPVWAVNTGDAVKATLALDMRGETLDLYTANMLANRKKGTDIQIRRFDALSGHEIWSVDIGIYRDKKTKVDTGAKASPVIGQNALENLVYFTVTGLSDEGREALGLQAHEAALVALNKSNGRREWVLGLESRSESSPVAVYDKEGNGWIIQCEQNGTIHLLDGLTGRELTKLTVEGEIEASPAVYDDMLVIGTTGKDTSFVYGIKIHTPVGMDEEEAAEPADAADGEEEGGADE